MMDSPGFSFVLPLALAMHSQEIRERAFGAVRGVASVSGELAEALLRAGKRRRLVVASDFDGTLCEHVVLPAVPCMNELGVRALSRLAALPSTTVAVVSGRGLESLRTSMGVHAELLSRCVLVGSHGAEWSVGESHRPEDAETRVARLWDVATEAAGLVEGVYIERKPLGVAVHVRSVAEGEQRETLLRVQRAMLGCGPVRMRMGKLVVEGSVAYVGKDTAVRELRQRQGGEGGADADDAERGCCVVALGDDTTDEDAFGALSASDIGLKVGEGATLARWRVASVARACEALWALALVREAYIDELSSATINPD